MTSDSTGRRAALVDFLQRRRMHWMAEQHRAEHELRDLQFADQCESYAHEDEALIEAIDRGEVPLG